MAPAELNKSIFKAYDIRGIVGNTLTEAVARAVGQALGSEAQARGIKAMVVGRDGRLSGPALSAALSEGITSTGTDVIDIGMVATPMVYFSTYHFGTGSGVMVTGSHNPPEYNGLKMMVGGDTLYGDTITALHTRIVSGNLVKAATPGKVHHHEVRKLYFDRIVGDIKLKRPMKVVVDCGNGAPGAYAPDLLRQLGCSVDPLFCEVDGNFPNHHPDPAHPENLQDLIKRVAATDAELGLAFDGDGDRLGVVTKDGQIIFPDRQIMLYAEDVLERNPGATILYDVKCTRLLDSWIAKHGGQPLMWKTGHSLVKAKLKETGAPLGGEMSGHIFFKERWYGFDDGLYTAARLLEILSASANPSAVLNALPDAPCTPELQWKLDEGENHAIIAQLQSSVQSASGLAAQFPGAARVATIDGLRVDYADGFGLARASNTTPVIVLRFEADTPEALLRIQAQFRAALQAYKPAAPLPF
jgi:phosphomannomutase / phosphoglucomutase